MLFLISLTICASHESDSITINQSLTGDQKITSKGGYFVLGFFTEDNSSRRFYIGIWYKRVTKLTPVWVANRATPVSDPTKALLHISHDGNLVLRDQLVKSVLWSTNATISSQYSTVAVLQDNGNLVLREGENSSNVFWQSIENPTHTWLPGAKIAFNKRTGVSQRLTSWKNSGNPAPGLFSYEMGQNGQLQIFKWNMSKSYWTSGSWDGSSFSQVPEMSGGYLSNYTYANNYEEISFSFSAKDNASIIRHILDVSGQMKMLMWAEGVQEWTQFWSEPKAQCQVTAFCGPFGSCNEQRLHKCTCVKGFSERSPKDWDLSDFSGGCTRNTPLQCAGNTSAYVKQDKFLPISSVRLPIDAQQFQAGNVDECEQACLNNCSCTAYSYEITCSLWYGGLLNLQDRLWRKAVRRNTLP
ncbi:hypothetical protein J5N97_025738 [Dioscorea zingiberensis]|uniref:Uncharacterized protein n=1 Tax=Dioscorea zingiberensis TaxID=325984 RepID=A0A9D5C1B9_9LILI|nr:hypothetical protein J5N97_025738 [Dioscorea zingiberensis]